MAEDSTAFDNKTMESIAVEDASLNQSEAKPREPVSVRPTSFMVPVVFDKENQDTQTASDKTGGKFGSSNSQTVWGTSLIV